MKRDKKQKSGEDLTTIRPKADNSIDSDVLGSYTGTSSDDPYEKPIQDADDL